MPRLVQTPALGLLSLFTSKDGGIGPSGLEDNYRAVVDARPMLGVNFRTVQTLGPVAAGTINAALGGAPGWFRFNDEAAGIAAGFRCPSNEIWRVLAFGVTVAGINGTLSIQAGWDFTAVGGVAGDPFATPLTFNIGNATTAGALRGSGYTADFWALPNQGPAVLFSEWILGTDDASITGASLAIERYLI